MPLVWTALLLACTPTVCRQVEFGPFDPRPVCHLAAGMEARDWLRQHPGFRARRFWCEAGEVPA